MRREITDPEVLLLVSIAGTLRSDYEDGDTAWEGSPFAWLRTRPSRQRGKIGEQIVAGWLAAKCFNVARSPDSDADRVIEGKRVEIKSSTLWQSGVYKFQQFRNQAYDFAICLGISPFDAHCWVLPKQVIVEQWASGGLHSQHGGASGTDTAWLSVASDHAPEWLRPYGGRLNSALEQIRHLTDYHG